MFSEWKVSDEQYVSNSSELVSKCALSWLTGDKLLKVEIFEVQIFGTSLGLEKNNYLRAKIFG